MKGIKASTANQTTFPSTQLPTNLHQPQDMFEQSYGQTVVTQISNAEKLIAKISSYKPMSSKFDFLKLEQSQYLKIKKYKGSVYYGQFINNIKQGKGIMLYENDRIYEGEWESNLRHGNGAEKFANGSIYEGQYINGKPEGFGKYTWPNGEYYEGDWINGLKEGKGTWKGAKGDEYTGEWKVGKAEGFGIHKWINGDTYEGTFRSCLKHGQGIQRFANGDIYRGGYVNGKPSGFGQYYWSNGSYFKGAFKNGLRDGQGLWKKAAGNCDKYEGQYQNDKKAGYGIFTWGNGNVYKGNYENDLRNGYGEMYWNDGSFYKGNWMNGTQNGKGQIYMIGEGYKKGIFEDNNLVQIELQSNFSNQTNNLTQQFEQTPVKLLNNHGYRRKNIQEPKKISNQANINFRTRDVSSKYKNIQKSLEMHANAPVNYRYEGYKKEKHPLIPKRYFKSKDRKTVDYGSVNSSEKKERALHSSFHMHKLNKKTSTSYQKSRDKISNLGSNITQTIGQNETNRIDLFEEMIKYRKSRGTLSTRIPQ